MLPTVQQRLLIEPGDEFPNGVQFQQPRPRRDQQPQGQLHRRHILHQIQFGQRPQ